jgi:hypothetical protein
MLVIDFVPFKQKVLSMDMRSDKLGMKHETHHVRDIRHIGN